MLTLLLRAVSSLPSVQYQCRFYSVRRLLVAVLSSLALVCLLCAPANGATSFGPTDSQWRAPVGPPLAPDVSNHFDPPAHNWLSGHRGVDLATTPGVAVHAAGPGTITFAARIADRGVVVVSHGTLRTTYEPVEASLPVGSTVTGDSVIGIVGMGGHCSSRCLHWGLRRGEQYLDPLALLNQSPPALKPLGSNLSLAEKGLNGLSATSVTVANQSVGTRSLAQSVTVTPEGQQTDESGSRSGLGLISGIAVTAAAIGALARRRSR